MSRFIPRTSENDFLISTVPVGLHSSLFLLLFFLSTSTETDTFSHPDSIDTDASSSFFLLKSHTAQHAYELLERRDEFIRRTATAWNGASAESFPVFALRFWLRSSWEADAWCRGRAFVPQERGTQAWRRFAFVSPTWFASIVSQLWDFSQRSFLHSPPPANPAVTIVPPPLLPVPPKSSSERLWIERILRHGSIVCGSSALSKHECKCFNEYDDAWIWWPVWWSLFASN